MIVAIQIGRRESKGFPGKNTAMVFGRPLFAYSLRAAAQVKEIDSIVVSSDDPAIRDYIASRTEYPYAGKVIRYMERPAYLCSDDAQAGEVYRYVWNELRLQDTALQDYEMLVLLMANAIMVTPEIIQEGITALRTDPSRDAAITVSKYNMWQPTRARYLDAEGFLKPMVTMAGATCDRDSVGDCYFADFGACIVRPRCLEKLDGLPPQTWLGKTIYPLVQDWPGYDVDFAWQMPYVEHWLQRHGYTELA
jgi:CMP-N-acetylneuraminic acid synthetase